MVAWNKLGKTSLFGLDAEFCVDGGNHNLYALGIKNFDVPTFVDYTANLTALWASNPETQPSSFEIELFPTQAVKSVPDNATAYPYRDIQAQVYVASFVFIFHFMLARYPAPRDSHPSPPKLVHFLPLPISSFLANHPSFPSYQNVHIRLSRQRNRLPIRRHQSQQPRPLRSLRFQQNKRLPFPAGLHELRPWRRRDRGAIWRSQAPKTGGAEEALGSEAKIPLQ